MARPGASTFHHVAGLAPLGRCSGARYGGGLSAARGASRWGSSSCPASLWSCGCSLGWLGGCAGASRGRCWLCDDSGFGASWPCQVARHWSLSAMRSPALGFLRGVALLHSGQVLVVVFLSVPQSSQVPLFRNLICRTCLSSSCAPGCIFVKCWRSALLSAPL